MTSFLDKDLLIGALCVRWQKEDANGEINQDVALFCRQLISAVKEGLYDMKEVNNESE